jgi:hypothetical protein
LDHRYAPSGTSSSIEHTVRYLPFLRSCRGFPSTDLCSLWFGFVGGPSPTTSIGWRRTFPIRLFSSDTVSQLFINRHRGSPRSLIHAMCATSLSLLLILIAIHFSTSHCERRDVSPCRLRDRKYPPPSSPPHRPAAWVRSTSLLRCGEEPLAPSTYSPPFAFLRTSFAVSRTVGCPVLIPTIRNISLPYRALVALIGSLISFPFSVSYTHLLVVVIT